MGYRHKNPFCLDKLSSGAYFNVMTGKDQYSNCRNRQKLSPLARGIAVGVFCLIAMGFALIWSSQRGYINLTYWLGVCGFKQRFGLPCPGCGWTHAAQLFVTGHFFQAFRCQPAAGLFCVVSSMVAIFALHCAVFGIDFGLLQRLFNAKGVRIGLITACLVIIVGWLVTLIRTILENSGP
jgi:hypothetical protein